MAGHALLCTVCFVPSLFLLCIGISFIRFDRRLLVVETNHI